MTSRPKNEAAVNALRMLPTKWAIILLAMAIAYVVFQPRLNQWFGWNLPSVASNEEPSSGKGDETESKPPAKTTTKPRDIADEKDSYPLYGFLSDLGRNRYESPAGLVYGTGSEEGHRLKHIARHLEDQPNRPGSHGVFKGDMRDFLVVIDDAYTRAKKGAKGTTKKEDDGSVVYEVTFEKPIGFIGGETGGKKKKPAAKKIRLVVRGSNVITAFPF